MNYLTHQLLNSKELETLRKNLDKEKLFWEDGKQTAGKHAAKVKNNLQLRRDSDLSIKLSRLLTKKILNNELIKSFALPKKIHGTIFSKSSSGMKYGRHIDNAYMSSGRADLSFTIFLNCKDNYEGGELSIECFNSEEKFKLNAGEIIIYPSIYLHSVEEVIDEHYKDQTFKLGNDETKLKEKIKKFRQDELDHKEIAYDNGATKKGLFGILDKVIKTSSRIAITISEKI